MASRSPAPHGITTEVADHVYLVSGHNTTWVLVADGDDLTLVDAGYPADMANVERSVHELGRHPRDIRAILVTHAHVDHVGTVPNLVQKYDIPVFMTPAEVPHARREYLQQATPVTVAANSWRRGVLLWSLHALRAGATRHIVVDCAQPFPSDGALDLPGGPVPIPTPGHTDGHCSYYLPRVGAVISGDALISAHPTSRLHGPQFLLSFFNHDGPQTFQALDALAELDADVLLPGHGRVHRQPIAEAVAIARANADQLRP